MENNDELLREIAMFRKGGTNQGKTFEMTMEEMQRELGLGVDCG